MISLVSDTINKSDIEALTEWLNQDTIPRLTKGPLTIELEKKWANKIGSKYSVFVNSGSSAILLMLAALNEFDYLKNKKIIVPALSWATDVSSPMLLGLEPILCDCNLHDLSCDLKQLEELFIQYNPSAFISVAPLGLVPNMHDMVLLCEKYDVILLEDICESMGSKYQEKYLGTFGLASVFSMYFGHHLSTIEGGFINTDDEKLYHALLMMRSHGWDRDLPEWKQKELREKYNTTKFDSLYNFYVPGLNVRSTDLQAFIGIRVIDRLNSYSLKRNTNFFNYLNNINSNKVQITINKGDFISNFAYPVIHEKRDEIVKELQDNNIEVRPLIAGNIAKKPFWYEKFGDTSNLPNCDLIDKEGFYLPNHQDLSQTDIKKITNILNKY